MTPVLEDLRTRFFYRTLDAIYTAPLRRPLPGTSFLAQALRLRSSNYDRVGALTRSLSALTPGAIARFRRSLMRFEELPLRQRALDDLAFGGGSTSFLLEGSPRRVLKIYRRSLGRSVAGLVDIARERRGTYDRLVALYGTIPDLIPATEILLLKAPLCGVPAVGAVQMYVEGEKSDLLRDHTEEEIVELARSTPGLGTAIVDFARITSETWDAEGCCADLVGHENLMLCRRGATAGLRLIDFGIFDLEEKRREAPRAYEKTVELRERLEKLAARLA